MILMMRLIHHFVLFVIDFQMNFSSRFPKPNFDRCQQILQIYSRQGLNTPYQQIHKFVGRFDRASVRSLAHFGPLQQMMRELTAKLVSDRFIMSTPHMVSNASSIFGSLNLYSSVWMQKSSQVILEWLARGEALTTEQLYQVYRACLELNHDNAPFLHRLRTSLSSQLLLQLKDIFNSQRYQSAEFSKMLEFMHRYIRAMLIDKDSPPHSLTELFQLFDQILEAMELSKRPFSILPQYFYTSCAQSFELCNALKVEIPEGRYRSLLKSLYDRRIAPARPKASRERNGESVFENRFQKWLYLNGYQFEGNVRIGLSEYDVSVKGKNRVKFRPFEQVDLERLRQGQFREISSEQLRLFENMTGLWYVGERKNLKEELIINLNGPFHYIVGDKGGIVRSEAIKEAVLNHYGFPSFVQLDFRQWQANTQNEQAAAHFLESVIKF